MDNIALLTDRDHRITIQKKDGLPLSSEGMTKLMKKWGYVRYSSWVPRKVKKSGVVSRWEEASFKRRIEE